LRELTGVEHRELLAAAVGGREKQLCGTWRTMEVARASSSPMRSGMHRSTLG
jgi:hypothetical protein